MQIKIFVPALYLFLLASLSLPVAAFPQDIVPFDSGNQSPLVSIYGLPGPGNYLLLPAGSTQAGINTAIASNFATDQNATENIILDGETTRFTLKFRHAFAHGLELGLKVPYIIQGGGFLDDFIKDYHRTFGMPQGGRDEAPSNRLLYRYRRNGTKMLLLDSSGAGVGDVQITAALQLYKDRKMSRGLSVNIDLKLPTGDNDALRGSGGTDFSAWLTGGTRLESMDKWAVYGSAGLLCMSTGDVLPDQQKSWVGFGSMGLGWNPLPRLVLKVQADGHSAFYNGSGLRELADNSVQLITGGTITLGAGSALDIGVGEDVVTNTSPDVVFYFNLRQTY